MDKDEFRHIEEILGLMHGGMAATLGVSEISVKRYATGAQPIPRHVARLAVALVIVQREQLGAKFQKLLDKYHGDT